MTLLEIRKSNSGREEITYSKSNGGEPVFLLLDVVKANSNKNVMVYVVG